MKKILLSFILNLLIVQLAFGTTYYLRADGSVTSGNKSTATGCGSASTAMNITQHNACTFSPGDTIVVCDAGSDFKDAALVVPSSGSAGLPITYTNSGNPIINGANLVTGSWTNYSGVSGPVTLANTKLSLVNGAAFVDFGAAINLAQYISGNPLITITDSVGGGTHQITGYLKAAGTGETYGSNLLPNPTFDSNLTNVQAINSSTLAMVGGGQEGNCCQATLTATSGGAYEGSGATTSGMLLLSTAYLRNVSTSYMYLTIQENGGSYIIVRTGPTVVPSTTSWTQYSLYGTADMASMIAAWAMNGVSTNVGKVDTVSLAQVLTPSSTGVTITSTAGGSTYNWASIGGSFNYNDSNGYTYTVTGATTNCWYISLATQPQVVAINGVCGTLVSSAGNVISPGQWFWGGGNLYVYATASPATVYTNPGVEAAIRPSTDTGLFYFNGQSYVTVTGLTFKYSQHIGAYNYATGAGQTNQQILNSTAYCLGGGGMVLGTATNKFSNSVISGNTANYVNLGNSGGDYEAISIVYGNGFTISNNTVSNFGAVGIDAHGGTGGSQSASNGSIYGNKVSQGLSMWGYPSPAYYFDGATGINFYDNYAFNNHDAGNPYSACLQFNSEISGNQDSNINVYYNIFNGCDGGIVILNSTNTAMSNISIYNNDFESNVTGGVVIGSTATSYWTGGNLINNIFYLNTRDAWDGTTSGDWTSHTIASYNFFATGDTDLIGTNQVTATSPLFTNGSGSYSQATDFTLQAGSPCINAGIFLSVPITQDYFGNWVRKAMMDIGASVAGHPRKHNRRLP